MSIVFHFVHKFGDRHLHVGLKYKSTVTPALCANPALFEKVFTFAIYNFSVHISKNFVLRKLESKFLDNLQCNIVNI